MKVVNIDSNRLCAVTCQIFSRKFLFINVYLPCDDETPTNIETFSAELITCESLLDEYDDCGLIVCVILMLISVGIA